MKILCNNCRHKTVCRFEQPYRDTVDNLNEKIPTPFSLELKCPYHDGETHALYRGIYNSIDGLTATTTAESLTANSITSSVKG